MDRVSHQFHLTGKTGRVALVMALTLLGIILIMLAAAPLEAAGGTKTIRDDTTGGDCTSIGTWEGATKTCTLAGDFTGSIYIVNDGITLDGNQKTISAVRMIGELNAGTSYVTVKNLTISGYDYGLSINGGTNNTVICNTITGNSIGINLDATDRNFIAYNTISSNDTAGVSVNGSAANTVSNNKFVGNTVQAEVDADSSGNIFSDNYFDDFDTPAEGCSDTDGNGHCDAAYIFMGGSDASARTTAATCGRPDLRLYKDSSTWATWDDFQDRNLTVAYSIHNLSAWTAYDVKVTGSIPANPLVTLVTGMPISLGNLAGSGTVPVNIQYHVPSGIGGFITNTTGTATNACGTIYTYP